MTADEIKAKIGFTETQETSFRKRITGEITFSYSIFVDRVQSERHFKMIDDAKGCIREAILRNIFDDQRREMGEAINEFMHWHQPIFGCAEAFKASERLMKAARYQEGKE